MKKRILPEHHPEYDALRITDWASVDKAFLLCCQFNPLSRPKISDVKQLLSSNTAEEVTGLSKEKRPNTEGDVPSSRHDRDGSPDLEIVLVNKTAVNAGKRPLIIDDEDVDEQKKRAKCTYSVEQDMDRNSDKDEDTSSSKIVKNKDDDASLDDDLMESCFTENRFYNNNKCLPVYKWGLTSGISTERVAMILINGCKQQNKIATCVPSAIERNTVFLVDMQSIAHKGDLKCDDLGRWLQTGTKKSTYYKSEDNKIARDDPRNSDGNIKFQIQRTFYKNASLPSLRKSIVTATNLNSQKQQDLAFIQYIFTEGEQRVIVNAHGNAKSDVAGSRPYIRTMESTKVLVRDKLKSHSPRKVIHDVIQERGGLTNIKSAGEFPRGRTQIYNVKRNLLDPQGASSSKSSAGNDPLLEVLVKAKEDQMKRAKECFIREVPMFPEPMVFLATDQQLLDVERFCTNPESFCVLGVDATFQIADYYYTFVTYRNLMLETTKGNHPVCIGPGILHKRKLDTTYKNLPLLMTKYRKGTSGVLVYGTDGETNIVDGFGEVLRHAKHLRCDIHLRDNIQHKLNDIGIPKPIASDIISDIFGRNVGETREGGLIDCTSEKDFDDACGNAITKWEDCHDKGANFVEYFLRGKAEILRESCRADIRSICGLGFPARVYTQNANECMNRLIKAEKISKYGNCKTGLLSYIERIEKEVLRQKEEHFLAVIGRGEYNLTKEFEFLQVNEADFYRMTAKQKEDVKRKFFTSTMPKTSQSQDRRNNLSPARDSNLTVSAEKSQIIEVPFPLLQGMFHKASQTVKDQNGIWEVPSPNGRSLTFTTYMVMSNSSPTPHTVRADMKSDKIECDSNCASYKAYNICSHSIAVAEKRQRLQDFLTWFKNSKKQPNLSGLASINMPAGAGKKGSQASKKRKGSTNKISYPMAPSTNRVSTANQLQVVAQPTPLTQLPQYGASVYHQQQHLNTTGMPISNQVPWPFATSGHSFAPSTVAATFHAPIHAHTMTGGQSQTPSYNSGVYNGHTVQIHAPQRPRPAFGEYVLGSLKYLDSRIKTCYGCKGSLKPSSVTPACPNDLVVVSKQFRRYYKDGKEHTSPDQSLVYYHLNPHCILVHYREFRCDMLNVPNELLVHLLDGHKQALWEKFHIVL